MKNLILFTSFNQAPDNLEYSQWCLTSWKYWADKHKVEITVLDQPLTDVKRMKPTWQRWHVFDLLDQNGIKYVDNVALIDVDTLIHPNAPNFFEEFDESFDIGVVNDDIMIEWIKSSIDGYKKYFPQINLDWTEYFNCGFVVLRNKPSVRKFTKSITDFYNSNVTELLDLQHTTLRKGSDQTPVNYLVHENNLRIQFMNKKWNVTHLHIRGLCGPIPSLSGSPSLFYNPSFPECGYVYHFNGFEKALRNRLMQECWSNLSKLIS